MHTGTFVVGGDFLVREYEVTFEYLPDGKSARIQQITIFGRTFTRVGGGFEESCGVICRDCGRTVQESSGTFEIVKPDSGVLAGPGPTGLDFETACKRAAGDAVYDL